jgi:hypothetical protein
VPLEGESVVAVAAAVVAYTFREADLDLDEFGASSFEDLRRIAVAVATAFGGDLRKGPDLLRYSVQRGNEERRKKGKVVVEEGLGGNDEEVEGKTKESCAIVVARDTVADDAGKGREDEVVDLD